MGFLDILYQFNYRHKGWNRGSVGKVVFNMNPGSSRSTQWHGNSATACKRLIASIALQRRVGVLEGAGSRGRLFLESAHLFSGNLDTVISTGVV